MKNANVHLATGNVTIRRAVSDGVLTETTKTGAQRVVPMHPLVQELLTAHRQQQLRAQADPRPKVRERATLALASGLVFPTRMGTCRDPNSLDKAYLTICEVLGLDLNLGSQVLRRSMNSNLVREGVDRLTLRAIMGHTSEQMTARYMGSTDGEKRAAVVRLPGGRKAASSPDS